MTLLLETHNLSLIMDKKIICHNLNLQINSGDFWGILGPNGAGKTTLLHALIDLHSPASGNILYQQKEIMDFSKKEFARKIGLLFQESHFSFPQTVWEYCENSRYPHHTSFEENQTIITTALRTTELLHRAKQSIQYLSSGEKKRLSIAALLTQTPQIYLLDEPTNHLDLRYQLYLMNHFQWLCQQLNTGCVMSTHQLSTARKYCNKILMLFPDGEYLQGRTGEILTCGNIARLYSLDVEEVTSIVMDAS